jgi:hypothetical protein
MPPRSWPSGYCATVRTPLRLPTIDAAVPPAFLPRHHRPFLGGFSISRRELPPPATQVTVFPKGSQNVVRPLHQQGP